MAESYTAHVTSHAGRNGFVRTSDGKFDLKLGTAKEGDEEGTNPEQLFGAAYAACFHSALKSIAKSKKIDASHSQVTAHVTLHSEGKEYHLSVEMEVTVPDLEEAQVMELAEAAHQVCPYSKATRNNIEVKLKVGTPVPK
ncbi:organic hydroperoxide resistance protein [Paenibacillus agricola]|uniref:Organic hydroperoxide resistance protein n=1 Tax=Paenibacillus agricola TaxID=2716264 RepID=A0ABX0JAT4_9BACL|nr:organic hydroperoxide resistance protein [Paenibacillus agricola]NHN31992.1 organic hydroperoxide resistance protein [Paenibacillus agricola]